MIKKCFTKSLSVILAILMIVVSMPVINIPIDVSAASQEDIIWGEDGLTRAEWLHNLVCVFDMVVEEEAYPDNYFADLDESHAYYEDILLAVEFGVVNVEAGGHLYPDATVTRDFAVSTLNFCLGYQLEEGTEYTFSDSDLCSDPDSAQVALNRGWVSLAGAKFAPVLEITETEIKTMLNDAMSVLEGQIVDPNYESTYTYAEDVVVIPEGTIVEEDEIGNIVITDSPETILVDDKFAVYFNGMPVVYSAVSVSYEDNLTIIEPAAVEVEDAFDNIDAQGVMDTDAMEIVPAEGVEVSMEDDNSGISTFAVKKVKNINAKMEIPFSGFKGSVTVKIKNPYIDYSVSGSRAYVALCGEATITYKISTTLSDAAGVNTNVTLFTCNIGGIGSFDVTVNIGLSGSISGTVKGDLVAGVECDKSGLRAVKAFKQKEFYYNAEVEASISLKASLGVTKMPVIKAYVYAEVGMRCNFSQTTYKDGSTPKQCTHMGAYMFARYGASASAKFGYFSVSESVDYNIYTESNSPVRIIHHYEDGNVVASCTRGNTYSNFFTRGSSRWSGSGWYGSNGVYGLNADGTPFKLYDYELDENGNAVITKYNGNSWSVYIPKEIDGYTVVAIGDASFRYKDLGYVNIPDTVTSIDNSAFYQCSNLRTVEMPNTITSIGSYAFYECYSLNDVSIPTSLEIIESNTFSDCSSLRSVTIPNTVTEIGSYAFSGCTSLRNVILSKNLTNLGAAAFAYTAIESIEIPKSLDECGVSWYYSYELDGIEYNGLYGGPFVLCEKLKNVSFEKGTTQIAKNLFHGCVGLEKVSIPDTVTVIENEAFSDCLRLADLTISNSVTTIEYDAFYNCVSLTKVVIPNSVTEIESDVFNKCTSLKDVTLSKNLTNLGAAAFAYTAIESIEIPKSLDECGVSWYYSYELDGIEYNGLYGGPFVLCEKLKNVSFEKGTTQIAKNLFHGCVGLEKVSIPDTVTVIENEAFSDCLRLADLTISNSVTTIEYDAFYNCVSLTKVVIPNSVETIEHNAFQNSTSLKSIEIPDSVTYLGDSIFGGCSSLESAKLSKNITDVTGCIFRDCISLKTITIPSEVEKISAGAFEGCTALESITFSEGSNLKIVYDSAFEGCSALKAVDIPFGTERIEYDVFKNCVALEKVTIPRTVKTIGTQAFMGCEVLSDVNIADYSLTEIGTDVFKDCPGIVSITLPKGLTKIGSQAFMNCTALKDIIIPESVTSIEVNSLSYPEKTTIYGHKGSCAETFATDNGFKFVDNAIPAEGIILKGDDDDHIDIEVGETYYAEFEFYPEDANEVITLSSNSNCIRIEGLDIYGNYSGDATVTATSTGGMTYEFTVHVREVDEIVISKYPTKTTYLLGESLDTSGMEVTAMYNDGYTKNVSNYEVSGFDSSVEGQNTLTVKWYDLYGYSYTKTFTVTIVDPSPKLTGISIETLPTKTSYELREKIDLTGMVVNGSYTDGSTKEITDYTVSGYNALKSGYQIITVKFGDFSDQFIVSVGDVSGETEPVITEPLEAYKLYFNKPSNWGSIVYAHYWNDESGTSWPGEVCTYIGDDVWSIEVPAEFENVIFNDYNLQTADLVIPGTDMIATATSTEQYTNVTWQPYIEDTSTEVTESDTVSTTSSETTTITAPVENTAVTTVVTDPAENTTVSTVVTDPAENTTVSTVVTDPAENTTVTTEITDPAENTTVTTEITDSAENTTVSTVVTEPTEIKTDATVSTDLEGITTEATKPVDTKPSETSPTETTSTEHSKPVNLIVDDKTQITVETEKDEDASVELNVVEIVNEEKIEEIDLILVGEKSVKVYDITLTSNGVEVQPDGKVTVRIPVGSELAKIYRMETDGTLTDMKAVFSDGYLEFTTEHFSVYVVAEPKSEDTKPSDPEVDKGILGDVNNDGKVNIKDATLIQKAAAKITEFTDEENLRANVNSDAKVNVKDATAIQKFAAKIETGYPIGKPIE